MNDSTDYKQLFLQQQVTVQTLEKTIDNLNQALSNQNILLQNLQQQIEQLLRAQYGKKAERVPKLRNRPKPSLNLKPNEPAETKSAKVFPESFPREEIIHDIDEEKKQCPECNIPLDKIKPTTLELLAYNPASLFVKKHVRCRYACRRCSKTIITASIPNLPIEKGNADASLLAQVIIDKYQDHLPLYRQECRWLRQGVALPRSTLCDWVMSMASLLNPIVLEMKKDILKAKKIHTDDTPVPVQAPGKMHQGRLWVYVGGGGNAPLIAVVYQYTATRSQQGPMSFLKDYQGFLQADAFSGYDKLYKENNIIEVGCMAHCRRKFYEAYECSDQEKEVSFSKQAIDIIGALYEVEREAKLMTVHERYHYRRRHAKPTLKKLKRWLEQAKSKAYPKSLLGKAISYALNHYRALTHYCRDGLLDIDNNVAERAIKPLVMGRKNYLFAGSHEGAKAAAVLYSLIETCKLFNVNTYDYLSDVIARIPNTLNKNIRELLPYHWSISTGN